MGLDPHQDPTPPRHLSGCMPRVNLSLKTNGELLDSRRLRLARCHKLRTTAVATSTPIATEVRVLGLGRQSDLAPDPNSNSHCAYFMAVTRLAGNLISACWCASTPGRVRLPFPFPLPLAHPLRLRQGQLQCTWHLTLLRGAPVEYRMRIWTRMRLSWRPLQAAP